MDAHLELIPLVRIGGQCANGATKSERHFWDFVVNGKSLWEELGKRHDMVSVFCEEYAKETSVNAAARLLLQQKADMPNDRRSLFVCSECGDLWCGAITAIVEKQGKSVVWKAFGYENTYEEDVRLDDYSKVGPFTFDAAAYEHTLLEAMERYGRAGDEKASL
jgi:hypothetical protein